MLGREYEDKWNIYRHKTAYSVHPLVYDAMLDYYTKALWISGSGISHLAKINEMLEFRKIFEETIQPPQNLQVKIWNLHFTTQICYHFENEWGAGGDQDPSHNFDVDFEPTDFDFDPSGSDTIAQHKEVCKALSDYMMYLLVMHPLLLPNAGPSLNFERKLKNPEVIIGHPRNENMACHYLLKTEIDVSSRVVDVLKGMRKAKRWEILKLLWFALLKDAANSPVNGHFQQLRQGGEFFTFMLFFNFVSNISSFPLV